jgi:hypothetical protein
MPTETAFLRSILCNPPNAIEKCRNHCDGKDGPSSFVWASSLLVLAIKVVNDAESRMKQELRLKFSDQDDSMGFPLDVLASVFSYLSPQVAVQLRRVNKKWNGVVTLHAVPWTIVTDGFTGLSARSAYSNNYGNHLPEEMLRKPGPVRSTKGKSIKETNFVSNATEFRFGLSPPTKLLMECLERMQKLKRIQMPTNIGENIDDTVSHSFRNGPYGKRCVEHLIATRHCSDITHLAITHIPCILSVYRFPHLTSLLVSFGVLNYEQCFDAVGSFIHTVSDNTHILPHLKHLGLHQYPQGDLWAYDVRYVDKRFDIDDIATMLEKRPNLTTLSLTGMNFQPWMIKKLTHPKCGLRSLAFDANEILGDRYQDPAKRDWTAASTILLDGSSISLLVFCFGISFLTRLLGHGRLACGSPGVPGFEPLRVRDVNIAGQKAYCGYPFRRLGAVDVVWGLTGGALFAEE